MRVPTRVLDALMIKKIAEETKQMENEPTA